MHISSVGSHSCEDKKLSKYVIETLNNLRYSCENRGRISIFPIDRGMGTGVKVEGEGECFVSRVSRDKQFLKGKMVS